MLLILRFLNRNVNPVFLIENTFVNSNENIILFLSKSHNPDRTKT